MPRTAVSGAATTRCDGSVHFHQPFPSRSTGRRSDLRGAGVARPALLDGEARQSFRFGLDRREPGRDQPQSAADPRLYTRCRPVAGSPRRVRARANSDCRSSCSAPSISRRPIGCAIAWGSITGWKPGRRRPSREQRGSARSSRALSTNNAARVCLRRCRPRCRRSLRAAGNRSRTKPVRRSGRCTVRPTRGHCIHRTIRATAPPRRRCGIALAGDRCCWLPCWWRRRCYCSGLVSGWIAMPQSQCRLCRARARLRCRRHRNRPAAQVTTGARLRPHRRKRRLHRSVARRPGFPPCRLPRRRPAFRTKSRRRKPRPAR